MSKQSTTKPAGANKPERMQCMEIWGGNHAIDTSFEAAGLNIFVHSEPFAESESGGGDIYYLTSCASGRISRFLLADVSGHGASVAKIATKLRDLLRSNVNRISQEKFVSQMNREFGESVGGSTFATAIVATFFEPTKTLSISVAGHPDPIYYVAAEKKWMHLDPANQSQGLQNLPLGVHDDSNFPGHVIKTASEDMFLLYSDAFIESVDEEDRLLGVDRLVEILNEINDSDALDPNESDHGEHPNPATLIPMLRRRLEALAKGNLHDDDATVILGSFSRTKPRFSDLLLAPIHFLGGVRDKTRID